MKTNTKIFFIIGFFIKEFFSFIKSSLFHFFIFLIVLISVADKAFSENTNSSIPSELLEKKWIFYENKDSITLCHSSSGEFSSECPKKYENQKAYIYTTKEILDLFNNLKPYRQKDIGDITIPVIVLVSGTAEIVWKASAFKLLMAAGGPIAAFLSGPGVIIVASIALVAYASYRIYNYVTEPTFHELTENFYKEQFSYYGKCQHPRRDFLFQANKIGVFFQFPQHNKKPLKDLVDEKSLALKPKKTKEELYEKVISLALEKKISLNTAYTEVISSTCGFKTDILFEDRFFTLENTYPFPKKTFEKIEDIYGKLNLNTPTQQSILQGKSFFKFLNFSSFEEKQSLESFLIGFEKKIKNNPQVIEKLKSFDKIFIKKQPLGSAFYKIQTDKNKKFLTIFFYPNIPVDFSFLEQDLWK